MRKKMTDETLSIPLGNRMLKSEAQGENLITRYWTFSFVRVYDLLVSTGANETSKITP